MISCEKISSNANIITKLSSCLFLLIVLGYSFGCDDEIDFPDAPQNVKAELLEEPNNEISSENDNSNDNNDGEDEGEGSIFDTGKIKVSWDSVTDAKGYHLYYAHASSGVKSRGKKIAKVSSPYIHNNIESSEDYYYVVTAYNENGQSEASAEASVIQVFDSDFDDTFDETFDDETYDDETYDDETYDDDTFDETYDDTSDLLKPEGVELFADNDQKVIMITWLMDEEIVEYGLYWVDGPIPDDIDVESFVYSDYVYYVEDIESPYYHTDLDNGYSYFYVIESLDNNDDVGYSDIVSAKIWKYEPEEEEN